MKEVEKAKAEKLRRSGVSMGEIAERLKVSKSTVSYWVRDVELSEAQKKLLNERSHSRETIEKRRQSRLSRHDKERQVIYNEAYTEAKRLIKQPLWCVAVSLYWGEGGKTQRIARIANSDSAVLALMMEFFTNYCQIPMNKIRGHVHAFSGSKSATLVDYWSQQTGIPKEQFYKTYLKNSSASKHKRKTLAYGTCQIYIHDTSFFIKMMAWIDYLKNIKHYD